MTIWWILFFVAVAIAALLALLGAVWLVRALITAEGTSRPRGGPCCSRRRSS
jgi:hypothetical protein